MKLHQIHAFLAILDHGSLRAAARGLAMTQPALTKSIKQLEEELGVSLFERSIRGMHASAYGRAFASRARVAERELRRGVEEIQQMQGLDEGSVAIGVSPAPAVQLLPQVIHRFRRKHPRVAVRVMDGQYPFVIPFLRDGSIDFVVGPKPPDGLDPEFTSELLFLNRNSVICRKGHPLARATTVEQLKDVEWILPSLNRGPSLAIFELFREHALGTPNCNLTCEFVVATQAIVAETDLMTILPAGALKGGALRPDLVGVPIADTLASPEICLIGRAGISLTPAAHALATEFRRTPARDA